MNNHFVLVEDDSGEWEGLYKNGVLVDEGHSLHWPSLVPQFREGFSTFRKVCIQGLDDTLPDRLEDLVEGDREFYKEVKIVYHKML